MKFLLNGKERRSICGRNWAFSKEHAPQNSASRPRCDKSRMVTSFSPRDSQCVECNQVVSVSDRYVVDRGSCLAALPRRIAIGTLSTYRHRRLLRLPIKPLDDCGTSG